jgi:hypothetical protein
VGNEFVCQELLGFVRKIPGVSVAEAIHLTLNGLADRRVTVAQAADGGSSRRIEIALAASVV